MGRAGPVLAENWDWHDLLTVARRETARVLRSSQDAEDAAQNAIIRAFRSRGRCLEPEAPQAWVRAIARNEALRDLQRRSRGEEPREDLAELLDARDTDPIAPGEAVLHSLAARELLARIPVTDRALLMRRYVLEQSSPEIAAELDLAPATVRVRLHRAIERLREHDALN
jgi:RNA polymerase sigma factor (sigma-70 family)